MVLGGVAGATPAAPVLDAAAVRSRIAAVLDRDGETSPLDLLLRLLHGLSDDVVVPGEALREAWAGLDLEPGFALEVIERLARIERQGGRVRLEFPRAWTQALPGSPESPQGSQVYMGPEVRLRPGVWKGTPYFDGMEGMGVRQGLAPEQQGRAPSPADFYPVRWLHLTTGDDGRRRVLLLNAGYPLFNGTGTVPLVGRARWKPPPAAPAPATPTPQPPSPPAGPTSGVIPALEGTLAPEGVGP
ncbi:MAG: hypothetical protein HY722_12405 [Planctomycetes bacterium]|nr:hypothetical protein [Planctomycetota bacterium]